MNIQQIQLSKEELARYNRHIIIPEIGLEGQKKLKNAKVLVIGSGGLGSPVLLYLAAAGVGTLGIVDYDMVDLSNLQRQVIFSINDVGKPKVEAAAHRLRALNPYSEINIYKLLLKADNALSIIGEYDVVVDCTDNFPTRYLVNDACVLVDKPYIYGSIFQFEGQLSVFNYMNSIGERGPNYRDLFAAPPPVGLVPNCSEGGVLGVLPGIIGSMQALEAIKVITNVGEVMSGRLFTFDARNFETQTFEIKRSSTNPLNGDNPSIHHLIDYEQFCGVPNGEREIKEISLDAFLKWQSSGQQFQLIDVREPQEHEMENIGGLLLSLGSIKGHQSQIMRDRNVVVYCKLGGRSAKAIRELEDSFGFTNLYSLHGGIEAYNFRLLEKALKRDSNAFSIKLTRTQCDLFII